MGMAVSAAQKRVGEREGGQMMLHVLAQIFGYGCLALLVLMCLLCIWAGYERDKVREQMRKWQADLKQEEEAER